NGGSGSIYVFQRVGTTWSEQAFLKASNWDAGDQFGISVSIDGDVIAIGAYWENSSQNTVTNGTTASADNSMSDAGAAYVFRRTAGVWNQEAYLKAPNPGNNDYFGSSISISGATVVVGAYRE
ncbi:FG-GAP repeat protein, partial [Leptospira ellisii]